MNKQRRRVTYHIEDLPSGPSIMIRGLDGLEFNVPITDLECVRLVALCC